nr:hypothetical protein [Saprospiraceae bacterium]
MPKQIIVEESFNLNEILSNAKHGDMIFKPGFLRSGGVFFVQTLDENGITIPTTLIQKDDTGAAYYSIASAITLHFADPVKAYLPLLENKKMGVRKTDWEAIEIDTDRHKQYIEETTGGKSIALNRVVKYFINHPEHGRGLFIYNPLTPEEQLNVWMKLSKTIAPKYLESNVYYLTAEDIKQSQLKNKKLYETKFQK